MRVFRGIFRLAAAAAALWIVTAGTFASQNQDSTPQQLPNRAKQLIDTANQHLALSAEQRSQVDPIFRDYLLHLAEIRRVPSLTKDERRTKVQDETEKMKAAVKPFLSESQYRKLEDLIKEVGSEVRAGAARKPQPRVTLSVDEYFPSYGPTREIFGYPRTSFGVGLDELILSLIPINIPFNREPGKTLGGRSRIGFTVDGFSLNSGSNRLFSASPELFYEYWSPLGPAATAYTRFQAGPSYMDYTFDDPAGNHFGAKRLGASGKAEAGIRFGNIRLAVGYRAFTEPAGINFDGAEATVTYSIRL